MVDDQLARLGLNPFGLYGDEPFIPCGPMSIIGLSFGVRESFALGYLTEEQARTIWPQGGDRLIPNEREAAWAAKARPILDAQHV